MSSSSSCGEAYGWLAAAAAMLAFGSFGVPIKGQAATSVDIDPLVFQSYKTLMCFATSWLILLFGESFEFTPWGIVSAMFWVPGGVATVYAVKAAGLAIGIGIGSSCIVLVSFAWGIFVFHEPVHSVPGACLAILALMVGLLGMSYYSSPVVKVEEESYNSVAVTEGRQCTPEPWSLATSLEEEFDSPMEDGNAIVSAQHDDILRSFCDDDDEDDEPHASDNEPDGLMLRKDDTTAFAAAAVMAVVDGDHTCICGRRVKKRHVGMLAAAFCGIWGGSILAPMKWCKSDTKGTHYLLSFSIGAAIVTTALWLIRYLVYVLYRRGDFVAAYHALPSFHLRVMWKAGGLSGLLWSIGNYFSLISVFYLGEGVGYPLVQSAILVSGLWGIFYFGEVKGRGRIAMWVLSSLFTVFGILLLSYEHSAK